MDLHHGLRWMYTNACDSKYISRNKIHIIIYITNNLIVVKHNRNSGIQLCDSFGETSLKALDTRSGWFKVEDLIVKKT